MDDVQQLEPNTNLMRKDSAFNASKEKQMSGDKISVVNFKARKGNELQLPKSVTRKGKKDKVSCLSMGQMKVDQAEVLGPALEPLESAQESRMSVDQTTVRSDQGNWRQGIYWNGLAKKLPESSFGGNSGSSGKQISHMDDVQQLEPNTNLMRKDSAFNASKEKQMSGDKISVVNFKARKGNELQLPKSVTRKGKKDKVSCLSMGQMKVDQAEVLGPALEPLESAQESRMSVDQTTVNQNKPKWKRAAHCKQNIYDLVEIPNLGKRGIHEDVEECQSEGRNSRFQVVKGSPISA
ncbi:hypothetical protein QYF36_014922 [Acer negundo]|nr:hypothetical protein QYF36_014922 [Acer negundo]